MADISLANVDQGSDNPSSARQQIHDCIQRVNYLADATQASRGAGLMAYARSLAYTPGTVGFKLKERISVFDFMTSSEIADVQAGTASIDVASKIQAAVTAVGALACDGCVYLPAGKYKVGTQITVPYGVSIKGDGGVASELQCYSCDGIVIETSTWDQHMAVYEDFGIKSMAGNNFTGFRVSTSPYAGEQDGFHLNRLRFFNWDVSILFGSCWQSNITNCWIESTNTGIKLDGHAVLINIDRCQIIRTGGGRGSASNIGVRMGSPDIEANVIQNCFIFGFDTCISLGDPWHCTVRGNTLLAAGSAGTGLYGIDLSTVKEHLNITDNMIEGAPTSTGAFTGIYGRATFTASNGQLVIANNRLWDDVSLGTSIGIQLNDASNTNQNNVVIQNNNFTGFTLYDIVAYNPNNVIIQNNDCRSSLPTYSIVVSGGVTGPIHLAQNRCAKEIFTESAPYADGRIIVENCTRSGSFNGLRSSATYDPPSLTAGTGTTTTISVTGAAVGDYVQVAFSSDLQGITLTAWVSTTNTVSVRFQNGTTGTIDLGSGTLRVRVVKA